MSVDKLLAESNQESVISHHKFKHPQISEHTHQQHASIKPQDLTSPFHQRHCRAASLSWIKINSTGWELPPPCARAHPWAPSMISPPPPPFRSATQALGRQPSQKNSALPRSRVKQPTFVLQLQIITGKPQDHEDWGKIRRVEERKKGGGGGKETPQVEKNWERQQDSLHRELPRLAQIRVFRSVYTSEYPPLPISPTTGGIFFFPSESMHDNSKQLHLSVGEGDHKRPLQYFFPMSGSLVSISWVTKVPG